MQQQQHVFSSREAGELLGLNGTTIQRAIQRGELAGTKRRAHSPFEIERGELLRWAGENGYHVQGPNGQQIDPQTGEVVEDAPATEPTPIEQATAARARLAGLDGAIHMRNQAYLYGEPDAQARELRAESNVASLILPSADAGLLEACRRLVALPESPQLWQALRAVLRVDSLETHE